MAVDGGHLAHVMLPSVGAYVPGPQGKHENCPGASWYMPGGHSVQFGALDLIAYDPGLHGTQTGQVPGVDVTASVVMSAYVPRGHVGHVRTKIKNERKLSERMTCGGG